MNIGVLLSKSFFKKLWLDLPPVTAIYLETPCIFTQITDFFKETRLVALKKFKFKLFLSHITLKMTRLTFSLKKSYFKFL